MRDGCSTLTAAVQPDPRRKLTRSLVVFGVVVVLSRAAAAAARRVGSVPEASKLAAAY